MIDMKIKAIITGSTGMVGEGVLHVCLNSPDVEEVLVINRRPCEVTHSKLKEIIHRNISDLTTIEDQLSGYNACYFCAGVSSVGKNEDEYRRITYDLTVNFAETLAKLNEDMVFNYVSGVGTDSSENGKSMWARVKGKTENDLLKLPFKDAYMFRPGYIQPIPGLKNTYTVYKFIAPLYPFLKLIASKYVTTLKEVGEAMINSVLTGSEKKVLECKDIVELAKRNQ
jgi:nucleoside-diphosphate-sugar epimerase